MNRKKLSLLIIFLTVITSMLLLLDKSVFCSYIRNFVGDEVFKSFLQFSFATMLGGAIFLYMSIVKDEEVAREQKEKDDNIKREAQVSTKLALVKEVDMLYRSTKHIKRTLRSRCRTHGSNIIVEKEFFESKLDELDNIQIALEQNRETVKFTSELFDAETNERLLSALRYSTRYLHDVFEDFEKNNVYLDNSNYVISEKSKNLMDFLSSEQPPKEIEEYLIVMKNGEANYDDRWKAFYIIRSIRRKTDGRRFKVVAMECISLATAALKK